MIRQYNINNVLEYHLNMPRTKMESFLKNNFKVINHSNNISDFITENKDKPETFMLKKRDGFRKEIKRYYYFKRMGSIDIETEKPLHLKLNFTTFLGFGLYFKESHNLPYFYMNPLVWEDNIDTFNYSLSNTNIPLIIKDEYDDEYTKRELCTYLMDCTNFIYPQSEYTNELLNWFGYERKENKNSNPTTNKRKKYINRYSLQEENVFEHVLGKIRYKLKGY